MIHFATSVVPLLTPMAPSLPPGTDKLTTVVGWVTGLTGLVLFICFLLMMGKTGLEALRHGRFEGGMGAGIVIICAIFLGAASAIFAALGIAAA